MEVRERQVEEENTGLGMEKRDEKREREERKNNVVIKGIKWEKENLKEKIRNYIKEELGMDIKKAIIGEGEEKDLVVVGVNRWIQKRRIMEKKKNLK